jgi:hypothetical protein
MQRLDPLLKDFYKPIPDPRGREIKDTRAAINALVNEGAEVAKMLKKLNPEMGWYAIAEEMTKLKKGYRAANPGWDELQVILEIKRVVTEEIKHV